MAKDVTPTQKVVSLTDEQSSMQSLKRNAGYIVSAIALALAGYFGWTFYQNHGGRVDMAATNDFAKIQTAQNDLIALSQKNTDESKQQLGEKTNALQQDISSFVTAHPDSAYAWQALMIQAKIQTDSNQTKEAVDTLQRATQLKFNDAGLQAIATLRYAEALLANKQLDEATTALNTQLPVIFDASKNELLGDIAIAKNDKPAAIDFYQKAWKAVEDRNQSQSLHEDRALLRFKMEALGLSPKMPDEPESLVAKPAKSDKPDASLAVANSATNATNLQQANADNVPIPANPATKAEAKPATKPEAKKETPKPDTKKIEAKSAVTTEKKMETKTKEVKNAEAKNKEAKNTDNK